VKGATGKEAYDDRNDLQGKSHGKHGEGHDEERERSAEEKKLKRNVVLL
jgi:hypothetical protein